METGRIKIFVMACLCMAACSKEKNPGQRTEGPLVINAFAENVDTKQSLVYGYEARWTTSDKISVMDASNTASYTLISGAGTTKGSFRKDAGQPAVSGAVEAFYPASMSEMNWPKDWTMSSACPMYATKNLSGSAEENFSFSSLGSIVNIEFNSQTSGVRLAYIKLSADEAMSGSFTVVDGLARIGASGSNEIVLTTNRNLDSPSAYSFHIHIPSGTYHNLTVTFHRANDNNEYICNLGTKVIQPHSVTKFYIAGKFGSGASDWYEPLSAYGADVVTKIYIETRVSHGIPSGAKPLNGSNDVWAYIDGNILRIQTTGEKIHACDGNNHFFRGYSKVTHIEGLQYLDTSDMYDLSKMFDSCSSLVYIDPSHIDTSNACILDGMFSGCVKLTELDLSSFNTENVESITAMFSMCENLKKVNLSSFKTYNVYNASLMFANCDVMESIQLSSDFILNPDADMNGMFAMCGAYLEGGAKCKVYNAPASTKTLIRDPDKGTVWNPSYMEFVN